MSEKAFWDTYKLQGEVGKNDKGDVIRVAKVTKGKKEYVDIRTYYTHKDTGELLPGKGICISDDLADEIADLILRSAHL